MVISNIWNMKEYENIAPVNMMSLRYNNRRYFETTLPLETYGSCVNLYFEAIFFALGFFMRTTPQ